MSGWEQPGSADAGAWFARWYGREPEGTWFAPGRVNLLGGPDYIEVFVLPFALGAGVSRPLPGGPTGGSR
jgi:galactokinase